MLNLTKLGNENYHLFINLDNKIIFSRVYSKKQNYAASDVYLDTLNTEKEVVKNMIETVANEIQIGLNSIYQ